MFTFNNTHIFTGYLKQLLSSFNLPTCKVYPIDFTRQCEENLLSEDPRVITSFDSLSLDRPGVKIPYLKDGRIQTYFKYFNPNKTDNKAFWKIDNEIFFDKDIFIPGLTRNLVSPGNVYDTNTHEYLGDFLRFLRDYYDLNLMSLYNCFSNKVYNNIYFSTWLNKPIFNTNSESNESKWHRGSNQGQLLLREDLFSEDSAEATEFKLDNDGEVTVVNGKWAIKQTRNDNGQTSIKTFQTKLTAKEITFNSNDPNYKIYAFPVKLFENYTIALECAQEIELFCGFYKTTIDGSDKAVDLFNKTYQKICGSLFSQPFLYDKLDINFWPEENYNVLNNSEFISRCDIAAREQDLKLFIKVPTAIKTSIVILEGDYRNYNDSLYLPQSGTWKYLTNKSILNFPSINSKDLSLKIKPNETDFEQRERLEQLEQIISKANKATFKPISKLQLLAFNTLESYPFSDRLVEYLTGSVITPVDGIADNIKRAQSVMAKNGHTFKIRGLWEPKMQKIAYDYMANSGPFEKINLSKTNDPASKDNKNQTCTVELLKDDRHISHNYSVLKPPNVQEFLIDKREGKKNTSSTYDILGYIDKDTERAYASRAVKEKNKTDAKTGQTISSTSTIEITDTILNADIYNGLFNID